MQLDLRKAKIEIALVGACRIVRTNFHDGYGTFFEYAECTFDIVSGYGNGLYLQPDEETHPDEDYPIIAMAELNLGHCEIKMRDHPGSVFKISAEKITHMTQEQFNEYFLRHCYN